MTRANTAFVDDATPAADRSVTISGQPCHHFARVMRHVHRWWADKTAEEIAARTGHHVRTVRRWMAGQTTPGVDVGFDLALSDRGPAVIELVAEGLPVRQRVRFWKDMSRVARRAELRARQDLLDLEEGAD